ncbi:putative DNA-repair protein [Trypanosoma grayi]|uniref:putative DNA-repair protein n=1 Tax=Trypanosoma grayi TaxID=71804 RepID=UPI0004F48B30|nr:putative DNA-repair protein [Trypanosoma grayi]KEG15021.1 putative DNA-repair protein [Trypanosoma grayi]
MSPTPRSLYTPLFVPLLAVIIFIDVEVVFMEESRQEKTQTVAAAAALNVDGYLRNASRRLRIPSAQGGRGTRRKLAMVTAANVESSHQLAADANAAQAPDMDEEWDEVVLPNAGVATVKKDEERAKAEEKVDFHAVKKDVVPSTPGDGSIKAEALQVDDEGMDTDAQPSREGTRPPLANTPMRHWGHRDPAYERMLEQQQLIAAQRRSERIRRAAEGISLLVFALQRGKVVVRESRHPMLVRRLLRLRIGEGIAGQAYPLLHAVQQAKGCYQRALDPSAKRPTLAPCWVTTSKDTVKSHTSDAIMALLRGLTLVFTLENDVSTEVLSNWAAPIQFEYFFKLLAQRQDPSRASTAFKVTVPHSLYLCAAFISLATVTGMSCRLVLAIQKGRVRQLSGDVVATETRPKEMMAPFLSFTKRQRTEAGGGSDSASQKLPSSCFWVEVWCPQRECFISVNPCEGCTTLWGAPYTFSVGGDVVVDVTPRYFTRYSNAFSQRWGRCDQYRFFWKNLKWDDNREASEVVVDTFRKDMTRLTREQLQRERKQLNSLTYAEEIPKTLTALQKHPLFVLESELARHEGVYPKDKTTIVGSVKGHTVYKRSAIVNLRSQDGWLRAGRCVRSEEEAPYKVVPPPASRPFVSPSLFFGVWQTKPFEPLPLRSDGTLPYHGKTRWYVLLDRKAPPGLVHIHRPNIARVARRMEIEFGLAVMGFKRRRINERRFSQWETVIDGIVVKEVDAANLLHAYNEWRQLTEEQEAAKRRQRANRWWLHFAQRMLSMQRVREQYLEGAMHGALSTL